MSKNTSSEVKLIPTTPATLPALKGLSLQVLAMITVIVVTMLFFTWATDGAYLSARSIPNLLRQMVITSIPAVGTVSVIISAETDLLAGSMMGLSGGVTTIFDVWLGQSLPLTILATLVMGPLLGTWNGWWVAYRGVSSSIATLAEMLALRGILIGITNGTTVSSTSPVMVQIGQSCLPDGIGFDIGIIDMVAFIAWRQCGRIRHQTLGLATSFSTTVVGRQTITAVIVLGAIWSPSGHHGVPTPVLIFVALLLIGLLMATRTAFGRRTYAIGGNLEATRLSGINVERTELVVFAVNGLMVAITGLILSSRLGAGSPLTSDIVELGVIATCVIGGTSLMDDINSVAGAITGTFIMSALDNGASMTDTVTFRQYIVKGAILLLVVWMGSATKRRARGGTL